MQRSARQTSPLALQCGCCCSGTWRSGSFKNLTCDSCRLRLRTTVRGCLVPSSILLLLLLFCFLCMFFLRFRVLSKRGSLSVFCCVHGGCVVGVPGLNIKLTESAPLTKKEEGSESSQGKGSSPLREMQKAQPHSQIGTQGAEFVASPDSSCQTHLIIAA